MQDVALLFCYWFFSVGYEQRTTSYNSRALKIRSGWSWEHPPLWIHLCESEVKPHLTIAQRFQSPKECWKANNRRWLVYSSNNAAQWVADWIRSQSEGETGFSVFFGHDCLFGEFDHEELQYLPTMKMRYPRYCLTAYFIFLCDSK